jgi:hypothetical protein
LPKSGGFSFFGVGGASKQDPELVKLNGRITEMWNQMARKYPSPYQSQEGNSGLAITKLEAIFKYLHNASNKSQLPALKE